MKCYSVPYEGNQEFIFFSYCHADASAVYPIIERLTIEGFRVWYDNGIHPGDDWPEVIATHLSNAKVCVAAISKASAESHNCRNEVSFAVANNKPFLSIVIEDFPMPLGMQLQLSSSNYVKKTDYAPETFYRKLLAAPTIAACRMPGASAAPAAIGEWQAHVKEYEQGPAKNTAKASPGFVIDPTWFEERRRLEEEIAVLKREQEEAEKRLKEEKEYLLSEKRRLEEERLRREKDRAEQERFAAAAEAKRQAEEEARRRAEQERRVREAEAKRQAEEEAYRRAEQERLAREAEAKRQAEEEARRRAEQERLAREAEAKRQAEEEARRRAEQERLAREAEAKRQAEGKARAQEKIHLGEKAVSSGMAISPSPKNGGAMLIRVGTGEIFLVHNDHIRVGRSRDQDIVFSGNMAVSRSQLEVENNGENYTLKNTASSAIAVDSSPVQPGECVVLKECAEIVFSNEQCFFVFGSVYRRIFEEKKLKMLRCKETGETRMFVDDVLPLNRYHKWKHNILGDTRISREHHAELFRKGPQSMLRDAGSLHGTFLNGKRIYTGEEAPLRNGDTIAVVETEFIYYESSIG